MGVTAMAASEEIHLQSVSPMSVVVSGESHGVIGNIPVSPSTLAVPRMMLALSLESSLLAEKYQQQQLSMPLTRKRICL